MNEDMEKLISLQKLDSELAGFDQAIARCETDTVKRKQAIQAEQEKLAAGMFLCVRSFVIQSEAKNLFLFPARFLTAFGMTKGHPNPYSFKLTACKAFEESGIH